MSADLFDDVIDVGAALASLRMLLADEHAFVAAGMIRLDCGHVRPTNRRVQPGDMHQCVLCGPAVVLALDLIEPTIFVHPDALHDLPELAA